MREFKARVGFGSDNRVVTIEPLKQSDSTSPVEYYRMTVRLLTPMDVDRELRECMEGGCHTYKKVDHRIHQIR